MAQSANPSFPREDRCRQNFKTFCSFLSQEDGPSDVRPAGIAGGSYVGVMDSELHKRSAIYDLHNLDMEHGVFKNFMKRHKQATRLTLIDICDLMQKDIFLICLNFYRFCRLLFRFPSL